MTLDSSDALILSHPRGSGKIPACSNENIKINREHVVMFRTSTGFTTPADELTDDSMEVLNSYFSAWYFSTDGILTFLKNNKPMDALCVLGLTLADLYPCETWSFTFGKFLPGQGMLYHCSVVHHSELWGNPCSYCVRISFADGGVMWTT